MRGRTPKPPHLRRGHHRRASTQATLPSEAEAAGWTIPELPPRKGPWHERVTAWWEAIWTSPMAAQYIEADKHGLYMLAVLHQAFWTARAAKDRFKFAAELRRWDEKFGLDPISRRRLQWEIQRAEVTVKKTATRRKRKQKRDPRTILKLTT